MVLDLPGAAAAAEEAFTSAAALAPGPERVQAAAAVIWTRNLRGEALGEFEDHPVGGHNAPLYDSVERALAVGRMWQGDISRARAEFESLLALADERGEGEAYYALRVQLCELELRAGRLDIVANLVDEWAREAAEPVGHGAGLLRFKAMLAAERGDPDAAALADEALAVAERVGIRWHELEARRARGLAALLAGDTDVACTSFAEVSNSLCREGVENPGAFPVAPDYAEALCRAARMDEARAVVAHLSAQVDHPWASAAAARSRAHLLLADGDAAGAAVAFGAAAARFEALEFRFDQARSRLGQGIAERRLRRKRDARASLDEAARSFEGLGAPGWAVVAEAEAARIGGRRAGGSELTPTEQRVANLVCDGLANKQIAATLMVTVGSVEAHLTRIYAKLGVRSRTDLVRALRN
jgi:DNA-binding CsgD family transcriptional regulator